MKKIILILLVLIISAKYAFAFDESVIIDEKFLLDRVRAENITGGGPVREEEIDENAKEEEITKEEIKVDDDIKEEVEKEEVKEKEVKKEAKIENKKDVLIDKVSEINSMQDDVQKIREWSKFRPVGNYVIINKKNCYATVYDKNGNKITSFEVGIGREIGDDFNDTLGLMGKSKNTTPAGEYTLISNVFNKSAYGDITFSLGSKANKAKKSKKMVALHKVPKFRQKDRLKKFYDGDLSNNRMSHGCINFMEEDFNELKRYIHAGLKLYVLPEESNNKLILTKNSKNEFEFTQTKY